MMAKKPKASILVTPTDNLRDVLESANPDTVILLTEGVHSGPGASTEQAPKGPGDEI